MKKIILLTCFVIFLCLLLTIFIGTVCRAEINSFDIAISEGNTYKYEEALDGFRWCVGDEIFEFNTNTGKVNEKENHIFVFIDSDGEAKKYPWRFLILNNKFVSRPILKN